ncbi:hypothetical protein SEEMF064_05230 [Salmonella enterica subsp. enterica serovar Montevideo str. FVM_628064]|nr:hypothetical protein SEEMF064_05230 [Salmonella enterica subsp. enterica serovar Montevideo str. FVM_628064]
MGQLFIRMIRNTQHLMLARNISVSTDQCLEAITLSMRMDMNHILLLRYLSLDIQNYRNPL